MIKVREKVPLKSSKDSNICYMPIVKDPFIEYVPEVTFKHKENIWTKFSFSKWAHAMTLTEMLCIESYCCGFLTYYSYIVRSRLYEFTHIHFCWEIRKTKTKKYYRLTVYLIPKPKTWPSNTDGDSGFFSDPPQPPYPPPPPMG